VLLKAAPHRASNSSGTVWEQGSLWADTALTLTPLICRWQWVETKEIPATTVFHFLCCFWHSTIYYHSFL